MQVQNLTGPAVVGQPVTIAVIMLRGSRVATEYEGKVTFSCTLSDVTMPWPYEMGVSDAGVKSFTSEFSFPESGIHTMTVTADGIPAAANLDIEVSRAPVVPEPPVTAPVAVKMVGTFVPMDTPLTTEVTTAAAVADFDGDGDLDVWLGIKGSGANRLLLNDGQANFTDRRSFSGEITNAVAGDLNGDGAPDLAFVRDNVIVAYRLNDGTGRFLPEGPFVRVAREFDLGDMDGDGDLDVVIAHDCLMIHLNDGEGNFTVGTAFPNDANSVLVADTDGDGDVDLLSSDGVYLNDGSGGFSRVSDGSFAKGCAVGDVDGDGAPDIVDRDGVHLSTGKGRFTTTSQTFGNLDGVVLLIDIDLDGDLDALGGGPDNGVVAWHNDGDGNFVHRPTTKLPPEALVMQRGDLNGDGLEDVVVSAAGAPSVVLIHTEVVSLR